MSLENTAAALSDALIDGLSFKLREGASYVQSRQSVTLFPAGSNSYSASGTRVCRIPITSDMWLDPSTCYLQYKITNNTTTADTGSAHNRVEFLGGQHVVWSRLRVMLGGNQAEDLQMYNRLYGQMLGLTSKAYQRNYKDLGFGIRSNLEAKDIFDEDELKMFGPSASKTVSMPILSGILNQPKFIPIRWAGLVLEFELSEELDWFCHGFLCQFQPKPPPPPP